MTGTWVISSARGVLVAAARTGGLVRLDLTANPDKLQGLVRQLAARDGAATIP